MLAPESLMEGEQRMSVASTQRARLSSFHPHRAKHRRTRSNITTDCLRKGPPKISTLALKLLHELHDDSIKKASSLSMEVETIVDRFHQVLQLLGLPR